MRFRRIITTDTCINYEGINSKEKKRRIRKRKDERKWGGGDSCLNYKSINSEPGREEESDKKLQEGSKEITEAITRWSLGSFFQVIDHCHANNWSDQKMMIGVIIATLIAEEIKNFDLSNPRLLKGCHHYQTWQVKDFFTDIMRFKWQWKRAQPFWWYWGRGVWLGWST